jgi:hypothetical protein
VGAGRRLGVAQSIVEQRLDHLSHARRVGGDPSGRCAGVDASGVLGLKRLDDVGDEIVQTKVGRLDRDGLACGDDGDVL